MWQREKSLFSLVYIIGRNPYGVHIPAQKGVNPYPVLAKSSFFFSPE